MPWFRRRKKDVAADPAAPLPTEVDPAVVDGRQVLVNRYPSTAFPGQGDQPFAGSVLQGGRTVAVGLQDDSGYWIVLAPNLNRDVGSSGELLFSTTLSYAADIPPGPHNLVARAIGADQRMGAPFIAPVMISGFSDVSGAFQIKLTWSTNADLDLHVMVPVAPMDPPDPKAPAQIEVWVNQPSSLPPRPLFNPYTDDEIAAGGLLDYDSNGSCVIDGRREENVTWGSAPPAGNYIVRVDAVSMCGQVAAQWQVDVFQEGVPVPIHAAFGEMTDSDTRFPHGQGAGLDVLQFSVAAP